MWAVPQVAALGFNSSGTLLASGSLDSECFPEVSCIRVIRNALPMFPFPAGSSHTPHDIHLLTVSIILGSVGALASFQAFIKFCAA